MNNSSHKVLITCWLHFFQTKKLKYSKKEWLSKVAQLASGRTWIHTQTVWHRILYSLPAGSERQGHEKSEPDHDVSGIIS